VSILRNRNGILTGRVLSEARPLQVESTVGKRFPDEIIVALHEAGITLGCLPVRIDDADWTAALFLVLPPDSPCVVDDVLADGPFAVSLELDLHEHENATVIEVDIDVKTPVEPVGGAVFFLTGHSSAHFDALTLMSSQAELPLFIGDAYCRLLASQRIPLGHAERTGFRTLLDEAVGRDAVIRMSGRYDAGTAFDAVVAERVPVRRLFELPQPAPPLPT